MICPFTPKSTPGHSGDFICTVNCALWVKSEKMCSFRLLADDVADHRKRVRDAGQEIGTEEKPYNLNPQTEGPPNLASLGMEICPYATARMADRIELINCNLTDKVTCVHSRAHAYWGCPEYQIHEETKKP